MPSLKDFSKSRLLTLRQQCTSVAGHPIGLKGRFQGCLGRVPLPHPRLRSRDQHAVVHRDTAPCACAQYGAYAVRAGIEPTHATLALPDRRLPAGGSCSPLVRRSTTCSSYIIVLQISNNDGFLHLVLPAKHHWRGVDLLEILVNSARK